MLYRLCVAAIAGFWLVMAGFLARTVWFPAEVPPTPVPLASVGHLVFRRELASDLVPYRQRRRLDGSFHLQPKRLSTGNFVSANGNFPLSLPGTAGRRVVFHGALELDADEAVRRVDLSISVHEPKGADPGFTLHLDGRPLENRWQYQLTQGGATLREASGTPAELLAALQPGTVGVDPAVFTRAVARPEAVTVTAHRGRLHLNEDDLDTYVVTIHQGEGLDTTVHVNQVGQIVAVKTFLGFDLYDETLSP